jgi:hypothetical protein
MSKIEPPQNIQELPLAVVKNMIVLATSGFGVVVALAWNEFIRALVNDYINPILGTGSGIVSLMIYAILMTLLAVVVTMQLAQIQKKLELINEAFSAKSESPVPPHTHHNDTGAPKKIARTKTNDRRAA